MPDPTHETWLPVPGFEGLYEVSDLGRVRSFPRMTYVGMLGGTILKPVPARSGHVHVTLYAAGIKITRQIHRLVLEAFVGPRPEGMETRHLDGNPANNALANLCWGTYAENRQDMVRHRRQSIGDTS